MAIFSRRNLAGLLIIVGIGLVMASYGQVLFAESWYWFHQRAGLRYTVDDATGQSSSVTQIAPISTDFGLVIEKLGINETVASQVDPYRSSVYLPILEQFGVAQAKDSVAPGQVGTTYLFGHSTVQIAEIGRYRAPFTLLHQLDVGDRIVLFYLGKRIDYYVTQLQVVLPTEVHYLTDVRQVPTVILQTCDPPGVNTKRLLVIAEMSSE